MRKTIITLAALVSCGLGTSAQAAHDKNAIEWTVDDALYAPIAYWSTSEIAYAAGVIRGSAFVWQAVDACGEGAYPDFTIGEIIGLAQANIENAIADGTPLDPETPWFALLVASTRQAWCDAEVE